MIRKIKHRDAVRWQVHSIVSKMMMTDQLAGSWDQPSATIVLHSSKPTKVQVLMAASQIPSLRSCSHHCRCRLQQPV